MEDLNMAAAERNMPDTMLMTTRMPDTTADSHKHAVNTTDRGNHYW